MSERYSPHRRLPPVRRERVRQEVRGWQCERVEGFRMTATNGTIFIEIGGDRNGD